MAHDHHSRGKAAPNANLFSLIFIVNLIIIGGFILTRMPAFSPNADNADGVEVVMINLTSTPLPSETPVPSSTPLPPTSTPTPEPTSTLVPSATSTEAPVPTSTPQTAADAGQPADAAAAAYDPAVVEQGESLYIQCAACHGPDARGIPNLGKDLVASEFVAGLTDEELLSFIRTGRPIWDPMNTTGIDMPPKGGNPALTDDDIRAIIAYLRTISTGGG